MSKEQTGIAAKVYEKATRKSQEVLKRRSNSFFTTMSVAHVDDDEYGAGDLYHAERALGNGDFYTGQWADDLPHGHGKYLWTDGCMYVGEWYIGKTMGKGKFSWPSGATYEGDFKGGYMDGKGTYTGATGNTYRGSWVMNLKHGQGTMSFSLGDYYEGEWRRGLQDGHGRYQWKNGNHYIGQWKNGMINGNGTMIWSNGNRYDGFWEDGLPKGNGTFRWPDGSFYVGVWSKDPKDQNGTYYPSGSQAGNLNWDPQQVYLVDLDDCKISSGDKIPIFPSQKMVTWPGIAGIAGTVGDMMRKPTIYRRWNDNMKPRRTSVDERLSNYSMDTDGSNNASIYGDGDSRNGDEGLESLQLEDSDSSSRGGRMFLRLQPTPKKQGETISKGHKNYELMLNLQLGIRYVAICGSWSNSISSNFCYWFFLCCITYFSVMSCLKDLVMT